MDCSPTGSSVHWHSPGKNTMTSSRGSSQPRDQTQVSYIAGTLFTSWATREAPFTILVSKSMLLPQVCPTVCDAMDCGPPGSSVHEIFQARILEWVAISFSRGSSQPRDRTWVSCTAGRFFTDWATREALLEYLHFHNFFFIVRRVRCESPLISLQWISYLPPQL